jgi:hypothetical protein
VKQDSNTFLAASTLVLKEFMADPVAAEKIVRKDLAKTMGQAIVEEKKIKVTKNEEGMLYSLQLRVFTPKEYDAIIKSERENARLEALRDALNVGCAVDAGFIYKKEYRQSEGALEVLKNIRELIKDES